MVRNVKFNQITLITDGFSNQGISPIVAARQANRQNISVNVVGITDAGTIGEQGRLEIKNIADSGGGLSQIVPLEKISRTVQMVTRQAINNTIQQVVHTQLTQILGNDDLVSIPPKERIKVAQMMDNMAEYGHLNVLLLIDQSASMARKMKKVEEAILDFQLSLSSRAGSSYISIVTFPGESSYIDIKVPWTNEIKRINSLLNNLTPRGNTPTGPAILASIQYFAQLDNQFNKSITNGVLDEYVI
ncbi:hypothetical protein BHF71_05240 [Vulcanibacillus modesticaldus]|uniref:VWFA domain-containing protein n=1 Tax=Vulcanibacillus modesticaldus TaxID=337097 RepID=A0A1D2YXH3_9BACI|nr:VWA domain-containing protein [Vulcanibacillus modesticaldus]OEG00306.1 hypothetical protein BHF71_05240 [Vulcanibacillus modesticaldus]